MTQQVQFTGSMPEKYDRHLGPVLFDPCARDLALRLELPEGGRVLELACATGILTRHLRHRLAPSVRIIATDPDEDMVAYARSRLRPDGNVEWRQAEVASLPFPDASFEAVVCQFGLMSFPEPGAALHEIRRVLAPRGVLLLNTWDALAHNDLARITHETLASLFPDDPPPFYNTMCGLHDPDAIHRLLERNGFADVNVQHQSLIGTSDSARHAAVGLVEGTPLLHALRERGAADPQPVVHAVATAIARECGEQPVRARMRALVTRAIRPA